MARRWNIETDRNELIKQVRVPRVTFSICGCGPAALSSKEQPLSPNSRFWRESLSPRALPESVNPFNDKNGRLTKFSKHKALYIFYWK